jgi:hypothetical protein
VRRKHGEGSTCEGMLGRGRWGGERINEGLRREGVPTRRRLQRGGGGECVGGFSDTTRRSATPCNTPLVPRHHWTSHQYGCSGLLPHPCGPMATWRRGRGGRPDHNAAQHSCRPGSLAPPETGTRQTHFSTVQRKGQNHTGLQPVTHTTQQTTGSSPQSPTRERGGWVLTAMGGALRNNRLPFYCACMPKGAGVRASKSGSGSGFLECMCIRRKLNEWAIKLSAPKTLVGAVVSSCLETPLKMRH